MKAVYHASVLILLICSAGDWANSEEQAVAPTFAGQIAPAVSTGTGLLMEPPLDLSSYTKQDFIDMISSVGVDKIQKNWTTPVVRLAPHDFANKKGLSEVEVQRYMRLAKQLFDAGKAIPVSDVGLISTQEDVIRKPMLNHISAFENAAVRIYLLVQKTATDKQWGYYSIVQDLTLDPPLDYYAHITDEDVKFEGTSCFKCHSSGPLAIHPAREDLVLDGKLAAALSQHIAEQPRSRFFFPKHSPRPETGKPMTLGFCTSCHDEDGDRGPLYQVHGHPIRIMVDFGYMPPDEKLTEPEIAELKAWLEAK